MRSAARIARSLATCLVFMAPPLAASADCSFGAFAATGYLDIGARAAHTATVLPNGTVLITGGNNWRGDTTGTDADLYDPASGTFTRTGSMNIGRSAHTATVLPNGKVLIAGGDGYYGYGTAELYDPSLGTFSVTGNLTVSRAYHTATLLPNGKVLIAGGGYASAELYDPATGTFTATGAMSTLRTGATAALLSSNGKVLIAGGWYSPGASHALSSSELYDSATGTFTTTGSLASARYQHTMTSLANGTVLVTGGYNGDNPPIATAEIYNPNTETWSATGSLTMGRRVHAATLLPNGMVLVAGGLNSAFSPSLLSSAELYNPATGVFTTTGSMASGRSAFTATLLPTTGNVLVVAGFGLNGYPLNSAELYR